MFPGLLIVGGLVTAFKYKSQPIQEKDRIKIQWSNFILWAGVFISVAVLGGVTQYLPLRLFENFYRSGSLIFGGGQVLIPLLYTEFVEFKLYLNSEEFLSGYALMQSLPGPVFSFCAYIGTLSMRGEGLIGELLGATAAAFGIFLPVRIWFTVYFLIQHLWSLLPRTLDEVRDCYLTFAS